MAQTTAGMLPSILDVHIAHYGRPPNLAETRHYINELRQHEEELTLSSTCSMTSPPLQTADKDDRPFDRHTRSDRGRERVRI